MVLSPLTQSNATSKLYSLDNQKIVDLYKTVLAMDVQRYFSASKTTDVFQCNVTGLKFYWPQTSEGDGPFYADLAKKYKGYYAEWKWEYQVVHSQLKATDSVLEIGCGDGYFLEKAHKAVQYCVGLEINPDAVKKTNARGLKVIGATTQEYANEVAEKFDWVCSFQVFEHISAIHSVLEHAIKLLKPGGKLAFGVPDNDSYLLKEDKYHLLNLPPHHVLLWDKQSLKSLEKVFPIRLIELKNQPLEKNYISTALRLLLKNKFALQENSWVLNGLHTLLRPIVKNIVPPFWLGILHETTVVAIFEKEG